MTNAILWLVITVICGAAGGLQGFIVYNLFFRKTVERLRQEKDSIDRIGALAVPDTTAWWLAIHQIIDAAERETIEAARGAHRTPNTNATIGAVGASEGCDLIRRKLKEAREIALTRAR